MSNTTTTTELQAKKEAVIKQQKELKAQIKKELAKASSKTALEFDLVLSKAKEALNPKDYNELMDWSLDLRTEKQEAKAFAKDKATAKATAKDNDKLANLPLEHLYFDFQVMEAKNLSYKTGWSASSTLAKIGKSKEQLEEELQNLEVIFKLSKDWEANNPRPAFKPTAKTISGANQERVAYAKVLKEWQDELITCQLTISEYRKLQKDLTILNEARQITFQNTIGLVKSNLWACHKTAWQEIKEDDMKQKLYFKVKAFERFILDTYQMELLEWCKSSYYYECIPSLEASQALEASYTVFE